MYFPKQHYENIVPQKSGINRFSASHGIDLLVQCTFSLQNSNAALIHCPCIVIDVTTPWGTLLCRAKSDSDWHYHVMH